LASESKAHFVSPTRKQSLGELDGLAPAIDVVVDRDRHSLDIPARSISKRRQS
jgi:hypothetical protein